ncbi:hypothetical protein O181_047261 [Austropuccinia psidii MF-1]|uniref:Reverse transcriptase domain-containing protein n=1 Tax=Austropuccinia psidii MF-1 TaxID=1389203 RepID=A0A9Q3DVR4_9BASI|nr:hypothetical protein [Austropuccinia psidii MF-1]
MKLSQVTSDNTRQTELWQELTHKEDMYKIEVINLIQSFKHEPRNSQRCSNSKMNDIEQLLHTLAKVSTLLNQNEGAGTPNFLKEVPKLKEWPHFSGEGEYDHMEFIRGIEMIKEDFELPEKLVTARFDTLCTRSAHRWYTKLRQAHGHQSWTWRKTQIIKKWANDAWRFKVEAAFESAQFNANKGKALPWFCQQKYRLTALYTDMSEFIIHRKVLRQCRGDLEHSVKSITTEQSSAEDIINLLEEVTTRTRICSSRVNLKIRFNTPWKDSVDKNPKENAHNIKYKSAYVMRKCHICQSTTHLANTCPKNGEINEIDIEKEPNVEKDVVDIIPNIERPSPPLLRRPAYPASSKLREALEIHTKELLDLWVIREVGHNEEVEITTPVIAAWNNGKSIMMWEFRALNNYTVPDRYPIPKIQIFLTQISEAMYIGTMDALKGFHQNVVTPRERK